jgi:VCBS repeat-containing protein
MFILAFGKKNPNTICLGETATEEKGTWYYMTEKTKPYLTKMKKGDEVTIEHSDEDGKRTITFVKTGTGNKAVVGTKAPAPKEGSSGKFYGKSPEEQESIKRQAIGHMVSRTIIGLQGSVDANNVLSIIDTLYKKYVEVVG